MVGGLLGKDDILVTRAGGGRAQRALGLDDMCCQYFCDKVRMVYHFLLCEKVQEREGDLKGNECIEESRMRVRVLRWKDEQGKKKEIGAYPCVHFEKLGFDLCY